MRTIIRLLISIAGFSCLALALGGAPASQPSREDGLGAVNINRYATCGLYRVLKEGGAIYRCKLLGTTIDSAPKPNTIIGRAHMRVLETIWGKPVISMDLNFIWLNAVAIGGLRHWPWPDYPPRIAIGTELAVVVVPGTYIPGIAEAGGVNPCGVWTIGSTKGALDSMRRVAGIERTIGSSKMEESFSRLAAATLDPAPAVRFFAIEAINDKFMESKPLDAVTALENEGVTFGKTSSADLDFINPYLCSLPREGTRIPEVRIASAHAFASFCINAVGTVEKETATCHLADALGRMPGLGASVAARDALSQNEMCELQNFLLSELNDIRSVKAARIGLSWLNDGAPREAGGRKSEAQRH